METASPAPVAPPPDAGPGLLSSALGFLADQWKIVAAVVVAIALFIYFLAGDIEEGFSEKEAGGAPGDTDSDPDVMRLVSAINT